MEKRRILILGRVNDANLGDSIIVDTCAYALETIAKEKKRDISITCLNLFSKDLDNINRVVKDYDAVVFPGGGVNSSKFTTAAISVLKNNDDVSVYFNASGVSENNNEVVTKNITQLFNKPNVVHITTRGDFATAKKYVKSKKTFPVQFILDPAIFTSDTYGIKKNENSDTIGVGLIRPGIFKENGRSLEEADVMKMYMELLDKLDARGEKWQLFCNGTKRDYEFAQSVLVSSNRSLDLLAPRPVQNEELVNLIAGYKGIIASRFHANIIATSLRIPTIALVWNNKMLGFAELTGCRDRYITDESMLMSADKILEKFDEAMKNGFNEELLAKSITKTKKQMSLILGGTTFETHLRYLKQKTPKKVKVLYRKLFR